MAQDGDVMMMIYGVCTVDHSFVQVVNAAVNWRAVNFRTFPAEED